MKKFQLSPAQLIELIKTSDLNLSGNKIDSSLINPTPADRLIERNKTETLRLSTSTSSMLQKPSSSSSSSSSTQIYSPKKNTESKIRIFFK